MLRTKTHNPRNHVLNVQNPILDALGFENRKAVEKAAQEAKILPGNLGPQYVGISRTGEFVLSLHPDPAVQEQH
jgi:acyl-[acyl-carrier-protein] desaturase